MLTIIFNSGIHEKLSDFFSSDELEVFRKLLKAIFEFPPTGATGNKPTMRRAQYEGHNPDNLMDKNYVCIQTMVEALSYLCLQYKYVGGGRFHYQDIVPVRMECLILACAYHSLVGKNVIEERRGYGTSHWVNYVFQLSLTVENYVSDDRQFTEYGYYVQNREIEDQGKDFTAEYLEEDKKRAYFQDIRQKKFLQWNVIKENSAESGVLLVAESEKAPRAGYDSDDCDDFEDYEFSMK